MWNFRTSPSGTSPVITISNGKINGNNWGAPGCGNLLDVNYGDIVDFDIKVFDPNSDTVTLSSIFSPPVTGATFTPSLPLVLTSPYTQIVHFHYVSGDFYNGYLRLIADDGSNLTSCYMDFAFALAVELTSFVSLIHGNEVTLNWTTAVEDNNARFEIERTTLSSAEWEKIGSVQGSGNSAHPVSYSFFDRGINVGKYNYRLKQIDFSGSYKYFNLSEEVEVGIPKQYSLSQNYPNPFNPSTKIDYELPTDGKVSLIVYDISGREVSTIVNEFKTAGYYTTSFNGSGLTSGIYFYIIRANNFQMTKKLMLVK